ncbi:hypothetical protein [Pararhizobium arenae]|uniref:hypothetical protein n=1 Tax=Pararhizobium arenae TaxID=1856850 RepID=UPI00094B117A|nr:hypothetical protein [Pararhizobium arenae]
MARLIPFKEADVMRAVRGATKAGMTIGSVEIDPKTGRIVIAAPGAVESEGAALDKWLSKQNAG